MNPNKFIPPEEIYWELFDAVQLSGIFLDSKTFVDCVPKRQARDSQRFYENIKRKGFHFRNLSKPILTCPKHQSP